MKFISIFISLLLSGVFSLHVHAADIVKLSELPVWLQEAAAREKKVKKKTTLKIKPLNVKKKVLGKLKLKEKGDGFWYYQIGIGTETPVECYVFSEFDGPANSLHGVVETSLTTIAKLTKKPLADKFNYAIDVGVVGNTPYLLFDTLYVLGEGDKKVTGVLKALSAKTNETLQICLHNEVGYRETFLKVFKSFVGAFLKNNDDSVFFESTHKLIYNDIPVGYGQEIYSTDKDGDIMIQSDMAFILPVDASSLSRSDSVSLFWSSPDGSLINGAKNSIENSVLSSSFTIQLQDEKWQVKGELQGKAVEAVLDHTAPLLSSFGSYLEVKRLSNSDQNSAEFYMWSELDPTSAQKISVSKISGNPKANFKTDMGPIVMTFMVENNGIFREGTLELGALNLNMELIHVYGEPTLP
ncbi:MAG: hypothetical protein COA42_15230 [Alteromonadaceae bacterium]|nr:MAG: hypothetical protein COA42_15230 [Alteromonadaceae bacterium]